MKTSHSLETTNGREGRPLHSRAFSAAWGRALGLALLTLSAFPSYAGVKPIQNGGDMGTEMSRPGSKFSADLRNRVGSGNLVTVIVQYRQMPSDAYLNTARSHGAAIHFKH